MIAFTATIEKFGKQGEKTGWTYILIPAEAAQRLKKGFRKSFRVKGTLDNHQIEGIALIPMGEGDYILPLNATMRKAVRKNVGAFLEVQLVEDTQEILPPPALIECLQDEPAAWQQYQSIAPSHQLYFTRWINSAKTDGTKAKRIAQTVTALAAGKDYGAMLRSLKGEKDMRS